MPNVTNLSRTTLVVRTKDGQNESIAVREIRDIAIDEKDATNVANIRVGNLLVGGTKAQGKAKAAAAVASTANPAPAA